MSQQKFWNSKFSREGFLYGMKPNSFIESKKEYFDLDKEFLCLGEGEGRNAIFFSNEGFNVTAIDASDVGLRKLQERAENENLNIDTICMDLNEWKASKKYGSIIASYLHMHKNEREELFKKVEDSLEKNAYFIGEFFSVDQLNFNSGGPKDRELLYEVEDFLKLFPSCQKHMVEQIEVELDEGKGHQGLASVIRVILQKK